MCLPFYFIFCVSLVCFPSFKPATSTRIVSVKQKNMRAKLKRDGDRDVVKHNRRSSIGRVDGQVDGRRDLTMRWKEGKMANGDY